MTRLFRNTAVFAAGLAACIMAATPVQTTQDKMDGNLLQINGKTIFASGMNIAWINFGGDVGDKSLDINAFTDKVKQIRKAGGNAMRWWLHTDASNCPKIETDGTVSGPGKKTISNIRAALDTAYTYGVVLDLCLFSFDMLVPGDATASNPDGKASYSSYNLESNYAFLTDTSKITTYLNNGLKPMLDSIGSHPAIMCWEVFNEPEGMLASANWSHVKKKITQDDILRITNRVAGFVHRNSKKMVSTGIASFSYVGEYSDSKLKAAGGDDDGYLDFYMAHYYPEWAEQSLSPFHNPATKWAMDRPVLAGEFPAKDWSSSTKGPSSNQPLKSTKTIIDAYKYAYDNGYAGAMSWAMTESNASFFGDYSTTAPALEELFTAHKDDIMIKDVVIEEMSGDLAMKAELTLPKGDTPEADLNTSPDLSSVDSLNYDIFVSADSPADLTVNLVIKTNDDWTWCPSSVSYTPKEKGKWVTVSAPMSSFSSGVEGKTMSLTNVKQILLQFVPGSSDDFNGTVYIDNVCTYKGTAKTVVSDFNKEGSCWTKYESGTNETIALSLVKRPDNTAVKYSPRNNSSAAAVVKVQGRLLSVNTYADASLRITDLSGKTVMKAAFAGRSACSRSVDCSRLTSGRYFAELNQNGLKTISGFVLK